MNTNAIQFSEIDRVRTESGDDSQRRDSQIVVHTGKQIRLKVKVHIPVDEHPNVSRKVYDIPIIKNLLSLASKIYLNVCHNKKLNITGTWEKND